MAYLMDQIAQTASKVDQRRRTLAADSVLHVYTSLRTRMAQAPRFLFDDGAIAAAVEISLGRPKVTLEAMRHLRVPYQRMWVEWPESGREKLRATLSESGIYEAPGRPLPKRVGFLIECAPGGRAGTVTWVWDFPVDLTGDASLPPNIGAIQACFDLDQRFTQDDARIAGFLKGNLYRIWEDNPVQCEALMDIWRTAEHKPDEWGVNHLADIADMRARASGKSYQECAEDVVGHANADVYGEYIIIWAVMLLLTSSRRALKQRPVDRAKINKARAKRHETPLLDHNEVSLYVNRPLVPVVPRGPLGHARKSPRVHMVSRYLARRGNLHWIVEPYVRGSGAALTRHTHVKG